MAEYGLPYMGSKSGIADEIIKSFPKATHFYDLFGGGFSITNAMLLRRSKHYKHFHFNELRPGICELIKDAIDGKYNYNVFKPEWISRERFLKEKDHNPYINLVWSFGNNGSTYLFSKEIEPYKKSMHNAAVFNDLDPLAKEVLGLDRFKDGYTTNSRRLFLRNKIEYYRKTTVPKCLWQFLDEDKVAVLKRNEQIKKDGLKQLQRLERLEQLQRLQQLQQLEQLNFYSTSYDQVEIKENSIIYCDPPYAGTAEYDNPFDTPKFLNWAAEHKTPVFISEYNIPDDRFYLIKRIKKRSMLSGNKEKCVQKIEKLYANQAAYDILKRTDAVG